MPPPPQGEEMQIIELLGVNALLILAFILGVTISPTAGWLYWAISIVIIILALQGIAWYKLRNRGNYEKK